MTKKNNEKNNTFKDKLSGLSQWLLRPWLFSISTKWIAIVGVIITVGFSISSILIYNTTKSQLVKQEEIVNYDIVKQVSNRLNNFSANLTTANVEETFTNGFSGKNNQEKMPQVSGVFDNNSLIGLTRPDVSLKIYNAAKKQIFQTRNLASKKINPAQNELIKTKVAGKSVIFVSQDIYSRINHQKIGYLVVQNDMDESNNILQNLRRMMIIIAIVTILLIILLSYFAATTILKPIKEISAVAKEVDEHPESTVRIKNTQRRDELGQLSLTFNQMLDRMQNYIDQQKNFVGDVSHELRTPVAVIEGHLKLLERWGKDDPEVLEESIQASVQEINRMKHLIQEMLDLTRAEQIDILYPNEVTNVDEIVDQVVENMRLLHPDFHIQLDEDIREIPLIKIYRNHLEQILIILVDNAIKYSTSRKEILLSVASDEHDVQVIIQDFGEGISKKDRDKIFGRFYRVDKARTRERGGNGLGLPIAKKLVESYHGEITVDSVVGSGSQFKISFPLYKNE